MGEVEVVVGGSPGDAAPPSTYPDVCVLRQPIFGDIFFFK